MNKALLITLICAWSAGDSIKHIWSIGCTSVLKERSRWIGDEVFPYFNIILASYCSSALQVILILKGVLFIFSKSEYNKTSLWVQDYELEHIVQKPIFQKQENK